MTEQSQAEQSDSPLPPNAGRVIPSGMPDQPVVYCLTPEAAAIVIDTAIDLGAPLRQGARSGPAWQLAVGYLVAKAQAGRR